MYKNKFEKSNKFEKKYAPFQKIKIKNFKKI